MLFVLVNGNLNIPPMIIATKSCDPLDPTSRVDEMCRRSLNSASYSRALREKNPIIKGPLLQDKDFSGKVKFCLSFNTE